MFLTAPLFLSAVPVFAAETPEKLTIHGDYSLLGASHWTGGAGNKTLLRRGAFLTNELRLHIHSPLQNGWNFSNDIHLRKTPDPQMDKRKDLRLLGFTAELYDPVWRLTAGDFFADFSQYTLGQALDGVQVARRTDNSESKLVFGYSQKPDEGRQFMRFVFGGRQESLLVKERGVLKDWRVGVNMVGNEDDRGSIGNKTGIANASNRIGSLNTSLRLGDAELNGEIAEAWIDEDTSPNTDVRRKTGTALRLNAGNKFTKKLKAKLGYEWVTADFNSLSGSAVPDRVNVTSRLDYKFNGAWAGEAGYRLAVDKMDKSPLNVRTVTQIPRVAFNWTPDSSYWLLQNFFSRVYWEMRRRFSQDNDSSGQADFESQDMGLEDEFKLFRATVNSGLSLRAEKDDKTKSNDRTAPAGFIGVRFNERWFGAEAVPSLRYQFSYEERPKDGGRDLSQVVSAGLTLDFPNGVRIEQRYSADFASRLAHDSDSIRLNVYLGLDYKIPGKRDMTLTTSYEMTQFAHDVSTERFSEQNFQTRLLWRF